MTRLVWKSNQLASYTQGVPQKSHNWTKVQEDVSNYNAVAADLYLVNL